MQMSAGCSLLRGTEDSVHRAYATLLLGAVARAKAGNDPDLLKRSLHFLEDGAKGLADHPTYKFRASYELALAYYKQESTREKARAELRRLKSGLRSARWHSASLVLESRLERLSGSFAGARKLAEQAVDVIKITDYSESHAEALIALGEAHRARAIARLEQARSSADLSFEDAIKFFVMARERAGNNPKILAVSNLQIASVYIHQHLLGEAHAAFAPWLSTFKNVVEHGFVHALAKDVGERLQIKERFLRHDNDLSLDTPKQRHIEELEAFLLRRAAKLGWSPEQTAVNFGIGVSALNKLKRQLNERGRDVPLSRRGRPRRK
jgi:tetratricopeptide (TPR) repeat protein